MRSLLSHVGLFKAVGSSCPAAVAAGGVVSPFLDWPRPAHAPASVSTDRPTDRPHGFLPPPARRMLRDLRRASSRVVRGAVRRQHTVRYTQAYERSLATPQDFWAEQAQRIEWFRPWDQVLDEYVGVRRPHVATIGSVRVSARLTCCLVASMLAGRRTRSTSGSPAAR